MMLKYTQPNAYFPDFDQGSTVSAWIKPGGLLALQHGILTRLSSIGTCSRISRSMTCAVSRSDSSITPALFASSSAITGMLLFSLGGDIVQPTLRDARLGVDRCGRRCGGTLEKVDAHRFELRTDRKGSFNRSRALYGRSCVWKSVGYKKVYGEKRGEIRRQLRYESTRKSSVR